MGLIKAAFSAATGVVADQWKEYFYCEALPNNVLVVKGRKKNSNNNNNGADNIISNGSKIAVADGQCMIIVDNGKVVDLCAEPGEYTYDYSSEPSVFAGDLSSSLKAVFENMGKRFTYGGQSAADQRVYYFNTKELTGNKYGTPTAVPFRVVDTRAGIDMDVSLTCFGEYSYRITNPILFYTNVCGNVTDKFTRDQIDGQLKTELLTKLQSGFSRLSDMGIRYSALPGHADDLATALNDLLSEKWAKLRGVEIVSLGISSLKVADADEATMKEMQRKAAYTDQALRDANLSDAAAKAMVDAANNTAGAQQAFVNLNTATNIAAANLYASATAANAAPAAEAKPTWTCTKCGTVNTGKYCSECGTPKVQKVVCPHCGYEPENGVATKFCPECGKPMSE